MPILMHPPFTPLESPAIYGRDDIDKILIPYRKGGVKAPSFLTGFTPNLFTGIPLVFWAEAFLPLECFSLLLSFLRP